MEIIFHTICDNEMKKFLLAILLILVSFDISIAQNDVTAKGIVFHDLNNNGKFDRNEKGIENVAVSNGLDVVITDKDGKYSIGISNDDIIFVIKPSNYNFPLNDVNQPKFYYIHKPKGSPDFIFKGVAPTGKLPASIDFPLISGNIHNEFSILVLADPQVMTEEQVKYYETDYIDELKKLQGIDFGITLGDIVGDSLQLLGPISKATAKIGLPWFHVIGNHDINFDADKIEQKDETFESHFGPSTYAFNHGKVHFIILDDIIYPNNFTNHHYVGGLTEKQLNFIENNLKYVPNDFLVVLCMHIPVANEQGRGETFLNDSRTKLFKILKNYTYTFSMSGHTHTQMHNFLPIENGIAGVTEHHNYTVGTTSGDWWNGSFKSNGVPEGTMRDGTERGYNIISFKGNKYSYDYRILNKPESYKFRLYGPKKVKRTSYSGGNFYVNFFQGSSKDTVEYKINDGAWKKMNYSIEQDPYISALRYEWDFANVLPTGSRPSNPVETFHLWKTNVPTKLPIGINTIFVRVKDTFGRIYEDKLDYEILDE